MVHRCCISSCRMNVRATEAKGLSYHSFPSKEPIRDQWVEAIRPHLVKPDVFKIVPGYTRICSRHFRKKDYSLDMKKRARLNSNAVPSVFPRKNTPLVVQSVLPVQAPEPPKKVSVASTSSAESIDFNHIIDLDDKSSISFTLSGGLGDSEFGSLSLDSGSASNDQFVLTIMNQQDTLPKLVDALNLSGGSLEASAEAEDNSDRQIKRRKRRKWNRTAFARPAKGKRKALSSFSDESNLDSVGEALAEISLSTFLSLSPDIQDKITFTDDLSNHILNSTTRSQVSSLQTLSLPMSDILQHDPVLQFNSIEQELLQSIQAVSLHCGDADHESHVTESNDELLNSIHPSFVSSQLLEQSSHESLFSDSALGSDLIGSASSLTLQSPNDNDSQSQDSLPEDFLTSELPAPTVSDIEQLANDLTSNLFTSVPLSIDLLKAIDSITDGCPDEPLFSGLAEQLANLVSSPSPTPSRESSVCQASTGVRTRPLRLRPGVKSVAETKPLPEKKLSGIAKKPKRDKVFGKFSVERFRDSDKDIEYYTGFNSHRNFEGFFRSLEVHVEKLRVTDAMHGVNNLTLQADCSLDGTDSQFPTLKSFVSAPYEPKKRTYQGRCMSRMDELFMTVIRLRRKLPEKVLGHMFCISQPTVSRIIRAWTMLLSKVIESYPPETAAGHSKASRATCKLVAEHSYTNRGLGIPDSFRQLFHSDLAKSIVLTKPSGRKSKSTCTQAEISTVKKRAKKCDEFRVEGQDTCSESSRQKSDAVSETISNSQIIFSDSLGLASNTFSEVEVSGDAFFGFSY